MAGLLAALSYKYEVRSIRDGEPHRGRDSLLQLVDGTRKQICRFLGKCVVAVIF